jgi:osmotically-inducible protein OsmY
MRRFLFGMVIASITIAAPGLALGGDREIADDIISQLKKEQAAGKLKGFDIDLNVEDGRVVITGSVASNAQLKTVLSAAQHAEGVDRIVNRMAVKTKSTEATSSVQPAAGFEIDETEESVQPAGVNGPAPALIGQDATVSPTDVAITDRVIGLLSNDKAQGVLRHFDLDVSTVNGEVWARGHVADARQKAHVLSTIQQVAGVTKVVDDITVNGNAGIQTASGQLDVGSSMPQAYGQNMQPQAFAPSMQPQAFAPSMLTSTGTNGGGMSGGYSGMAQPMPMQGGPSYGAGVPRYDNPQMPNYAWPSYAAAPNYSAVTYPKQYSASAWPYIGPFYPYPQVPLGWRKVALEWDDGLWYLDFTSK